MANRRPVRHQGRCSRAPPQLSDSRTQPPWRRRRKVPGRIGRRRARGCDGRSDRGFVLPGRPGATKLTKRRLYLVRQRLDLLRIDPIGSCACRGGARDGSNRQSHRQRHCYRLQSHQHTLPVSAQLPRNSLDGFNLRMIKHEAQWARSPTHCWGRSHGCNRPYKSSRGDGRETDQGYPGPVLVTVFQMKEIELP